MSLSWGLMSSGVKVTPSTWNIHMKRMTPTLNIGESNTMFSGKFTGFHRFLVKKKKSLFVTLSKLYNIYAVFFLS